MRLFAFIFFILTITSCKTHKTTKIKEGYIEYEIIYLNEEKESLYSFMLPKTMIVEFNKNAIKNSLSGFSGNFNFSTIINTKTDSAIALFQIMNQKYYYIDDEKGPSDLFGILPDVKLINTKDTAIISGYICNKLIVKNLLDTANNFSIFYTNDIKIHHPNKKTPFHKINGVLLDFQLNICNMDMRFVAKKIIETDIHDSVFRIPNDYKKVNRETVDKIILMLE